MYKYDNLNNSDTSIELTAVEQNSDVDEPLLNSEHEPVKPKKSERIYWIDCLRVFASMLVVYIHCTGVDLGPVEFKSYNWKALFFLNSLPRPCVPLFIMISGIFFLNPDKPLTLSKLFKKNILRIFKGYIFWSFYYNVIDAYIINWAQWEYTYNRDLLIETIKYIFLGGGHLWYLTFCMGLYMVTPIFRAVCTDRKNSWYVFWLCTIINQIIPTFCDLIDNLLVEPVPEGEEAPKNILKEFSSTVRDFTNSLAVYQAWGFISYFILGYLLSSQRFTKKIHIVICYLIGIFGIVITVILRFASSYHINEETNIFGEYNSFTVAMGTLGIFTFFQYTVDRWIQPFMKVDFFKKLLFILSDCSFGVYLIHMTIYHISYRFLNFHPQTFDPLFCAPLFSAAVYIVSVLIIYLMRKISILKVIT